MNRTGYRFAILMICVGVMAMFAGCSDKKTETKEEVTGGRIDNSDYNASKVIESDELVLFETKFYRNSDYVYDTEREYYFKMTKDDNGVFTISEGKDANLICETDEEFAIKLQKIIRDNNLIELNGTNSQTAGLAPEYGPCSLKASYASGENLNIFMNGDPDAKWTWEVLDLFANEFASHNIKDLLPKREESDITRFNIEYAYGDIRYYYGEILVPVTEEEKNRDFEDVMTNGINEENCVKEVYAEPFDRTGKTQITDERRAYITEDYYKKIKEILDDSDIIYFLNGEIIPGDFDYENTPAFFEIYIEYANGVRISGFSDDPWQCEQFKTIAKNMSEFYEDYLEKNNHITVN